ncbi:hypothetical protein G6011_08211 [Alternaria panax]|uniref:Uncharacterized protein n=1 Tax=Alternaria panax TaxID=48097 RepID=A0AAD4I8G6_9PLEO|nr:hypothetical protein G6011_08211 [Alternaria panax]
MTCAASGSCGASPCVSSAPIVVGVSRAAPHKLTAEQKEELKKKQVERAEKKRQAREIRYKAWADTKAKLSDTTSKKAKLRLYGTLLKLRLQHFSAGDSGGCSSSADAGVSSHSHAGDSGTTHTSHHAGDGGSYYSGGDSGALIIPQASVNNYALTAEEIAERERRHKEKKEKKQQRREVRAEVATSVKGKLHEATRKREKIRLAVTWLTLKLHL